MGKGANVSEQSGVTPAEQEARAWALDTIGKMPAHAKATSEWWGIAADVLAANVLPLIQAKEEAEAVWQGLVNIVSCSSPDGSAELGQVRYAYERANKAWEIADALADKLTYLLEWVEEYRINGKSPTYDALSPARAALALHAEAKTKAGGGR
jgi:hypothetical protein